MEDPEVPEKYAELARKWLEGTATPAEQREYDEWFAETGGDGVMIPGDRGDSDEAYRNRLFAQISGRLRNEGRHRPLWFRAAVAASVSIVLLSAGGYFYWKKQQGTSKGTIAATSPGEIYFAGNRATLELADGSELALQEIADGTRTEQDGAVFSKEEDKVVYQNKGTGAETSAYNVLRVPRGGQFHVVLADGTRAWLNSESSLRFPVAFTGAAREVELSGEAYFEVAKSRNGNASVPFRVRVGGRETVEVLGTHFNIMAYAAEKAIRTTLIEGSVSVSRPGSARGVILKPLQESIYSDGSYHVRSDVDPGEAVSWKEGIIRYQGADIPTIMRQIERWYNVEVAYEGPVPQRSFNGGISRSSSLSQILKILEINDIHVRAEGRRLVVLP
ncbi:FecR family protein [Dyadobacter jiangsuensis]|uniref:FecR family protein n=1 Tax=Dyadobacter jiangsuensis TaxID=1591085 RepID=A0A2P8FAQ0_9BACT|nr:FecR family protein [Dyadobacter jiangsuensis]PSL18803.1 FecR family protein [Dyadobacter jiangsuensis]